MKGRWIALAAVIVSIAAGAVFVRSRPAADQSEAPAPAAATNGIVPFRMEQQWLIRLKLAQVKEAKLPPQIYSTGRVIAAPANHAMVAPPVSGIIETRELPRIGQRVSR